jgi:hypothetical protein
MRRPRACTGVEKVCVTLVVGAVWAVKVISGTVVQVTMSIDDWIW